jgi:DNA-binding protein HU-beta
MIRKYGEDMANKLMSKSELIQKLAEKHADAVTRKDVKGVIESLAEIGYKELKKTPPSLCPDSPNS